VEEFERLLRQNTVGALRVAQAVLPTMREGGSVRLLFVSSVLGGPTLPASGAYAATKWALEALAETLALEVGHFGVKFNDWLAEQLQEADIKVSRRYGHWPSDFI
jgi:NAD(P)-dependent dehydrogenase (short-subunit alcohol dehydrogenase family)